MLGMESYPGVFTPTECFAALACGADGLKIFPAFLMGTEGLKAIRAVLPKDTEVYVVGGVGAGRLRRLGRGQRQRCRPRHLALQARHEPGRHRRPRPRLGGRLGRGHGMSATLFDDRQCALGEGPLWHPERKQLYWFDILGNRLLTVEDGEQRHWQFDEHVSAAGWTGPRHPADRQRDRPLPLRPDQRQGAPGLRRWKPTTP